MTEDPSADGWHYVIAHMDYREIVDYINRNFNELYSPDTREEPAEVLRVSPKDWTELAYFLRDDENLLFDSMMCITGIDYGIEDENLGVAYNLHSMTHHHKLEVRIDVPKSKPMIPSVEKIWRMADWFEREIYDMYGITFEGHRDHRRILLPEDWVGFPLRKDYEFPETWHGIVVPKIKEEWE